jgi:hypothetical protein
LSLLVDRRLHLLSAVAAGDFDQGRLC